MSVILENNDNLKKAVYEVLAFLDIFDYPPTAMEIWRFLGVKADLGELVPLLLTACRHSFSGGAMEGLGVVNFTRDDALGTSTSSDFFSDRGINLGGFYFLPGREELVTKRSEFFHLAEKKYRVARRAATFLKFIPGIKLVAVCNNFYYKPESDVDLFIIVKSGRLWLTRAITTAVLHLARLRRHGLKIANRACLSFYITEDSLNLEGITLKPQDPYFNYWLAFLQPVYGLDVYEKFWSANTWLEKYFPNVFLFKNCRINEVKDSFFSLFFKKIFFWWFKTSLANYPEMFCKKLQLLKMSGKASGSGVIISDNILKFHENDRRAEFREKLKEKINV